MVSITREKSNWEAEFNNITYKQAKEIAKKENVKEISIVHRIGRTEQINPDDPLKVYLDIREYDENSIRNSKLELMEGRFPENSNEIIIASRDRDSNSDVTDKHTGDKIRAEVNGETKEYEVVGIVRKIDFNDIFMWAGITCAEQEISDETMVNVRIITHDLQKIYETVKK